MTPEPEPQGMTTLEKFDLIGGCSLILVLVAIMIFA